MSQELKTLRVTARENSCKIDSLNRKLDKLTDNFNHRLELLNDQLSRLVEKQSKRSSNINHNNRALLDQQKSILKLQRSKLDQSFLELESYRHEIQG
jgi:hypothetical protein